MLQRNLDEFLMLVSTGVYLVLLQPVWAGSIKDPFQHSEDGRMVMLVCSEEVWLVNLQSISL